MGVPSWTPLQRWQNTIRKNKRAGSCNREVMGGGNPVQTCPTKI